MFGIGKVGSRMALPNEGSAYARARTTPLPSPLFLLLVLLSVIDEAAANFCPSIVPYANILTLAIAVAVATHCLIFPN